MRNIPVGYNSYKKRQESEVLDRCLAHAADYEKNETLFPLIEDAFYQIGTLGGGNHFIELQEDQDGYLGIMIHSGSRHFGKEICDHFHNRVLQILYHSSRTCTSIKITKYTCTSLWIPPIDILVHVCYHKTSKSDRQRRRKSSGSFSLCRRDSDSHHRTPHGQAETSALLFYPQQFSARCTPAGLPVLLHGERIPEQRKSASAGLQRMLCKRRKTSGWFGGASQKRHAVSGIPAFRSRRTGTPAQNVPVRLCQCFPCRAGTFSGCAGRRAERRRRRLRRAQRTKTGCTGHTPRSRFSVGFYGIGLGGFSRFALGSFCVL